ncbi:MAG: 4-alpha-glucanotransferase [Suipraeoptans sp.]
MRSSGILLPVASLPSKYGIGCFSKEAYKFVDELKKAGQKYWQILPLGPTGYGDSPYQSFSTNAGNTYFIDLEQLIKEGLLTQDECDETDFGDDEGVVDYGIIYKNRIKLLRKAYNRSNCDTNEEYLEFMDEEKHWLPDYALYSAVKRYMNDRSWLEWDDDIRLRKEEALAKYKELLKDDIKFYQYIQFLFHQQWLGLKSYANCKEIEIIGDIPIYVAMDSVDAWANPELFLFDEDVKPIAQAGVPPDGFSETGQLWGNPLYDWEYHKKTGYKWWIKRIEHQRKLYDVIRIDHFRGLDEYYSIPIEDVTAENGKWIKGPGLELFEVLEEALGELKIIAEDLGYLTPSVRKLLKDTNYPGMKVLQFAFDSREESDYLPHTYQKRCVVYTGTHDNNTLRGWFKTMSREDRAYALRYIGVKELKDDEIAKAFIRMAMSSVADLCVIPIQDYLNLSDEARINTPATIGNNWIWRMKSDAIDDILLQEIRSITKLYGRL